jgi:type IV secretion system protein TrbD
MSNRTPVRKSLLRKIAWLGGDRRLVGLSGLISVTLCWIMFNGFGFFYGISIALPALLFLGILWVAREAYKADPWMIDIVLRQFKYRKYYAPKSDLATEHPQVRDFT